MELYYPYLCKQRSSKPSSTVFDDVIVPVSSQTAAFVRKCERFRRKVESDLRKVHCSVSWPQSVDSNSVTLQFSTTPQQLSSKLKPSEWASECRRIIEEHLKTISTKVVRIPHPHVYEDFVKQLEKTTSAELAELHVEKDAAGCSLHFTGVLETVEKVQSICSSLMAKLTKSEKRGHELISGLSIPQIEILKNSDFEKSLPKDLDVSIDDRGVALEGTDKSIAQAKSVIQQIVPFDMKHVTHAYDAAKLRVLKKQGTSDYFKQKFHSTGWNLAWTIDETGITMYGKSSVILNDAFIVISKELVLRKVPLDPHGLSALQLPEWLNMKQSLCKTFPTLDINLQESELVCCGICEQVDLACDQINNFFACRKVFEHLEPMPEERVSYLQKHMHNELRQIVDNLSEKPFVLTIEPTVNGKHSGVLFRGPQHLVERAKQEVNVLSGQILESVFSVTNSEMPINFDPLKLVELMESKRKVVVVFSDDCGSASSDGNCMIV